MFTRWNRGLLGVVIVAALSSSTAQAQSVVATLKSYDALMDDLTYIAKLVGQEDRFKQVNGLIEAVTGSSDLNKAGLDTKRPIGVYLLGVPDPGQEPKGAVFIPVTKEEDFIELIKKIPPSLEPEKGKEKGFYKVSLGDKTIHMRFVNDYLYISDNEATLTGTLPNPTSFLPAANKNNLFAATVRLGEIPKEKKQQFLKEIDKQIEKDSKKKSNESDAQYQFRVAATKMARETLSQIVDDALEGSLAFRIDKDANSMGWDLALTPKPDSKLAGRIRNFSNTQGVSPVHFEISFGKLAMLLMSDKEEDKTLRAAREVFQAASKDNSANVKLSLQGGDALHLRLDVSTHLIKLGAAFAPLGERD